MDNLELLKNLEDNSVDLIYCDILYNSGKVFDDYNDNLGSPEEAIAWYEPRIKEMHRVLSKTGSIYIHCNWRLDSYVRVLMDKVFGFYNFKNRIYRKHSGIRGFVNNYDSQMDIILYYTKDKDNYTFNEIKGDRLYTSPLFENGFVSERSFELNYKGFNFNPKEENKHWLMPLNKIKELIDNNEFILIDGNPYRKSYTIPLGNLWDEDFMLDNYSRTDIAESYDTPKPNAVLNRIIKVSSNKGDTVADFFMGGGTTAIEIIKEKRVGLLCDISDKACKVTVSKIKKLKG